MKKPYNVGDIDKYLMGLLEKMVYFTPFPQRVELIFDSLKKKKEFSRLKLSQSSAIVNVLSC